MGYELSSPALVSAIINSLWQGLLMVGGALLALRCFPRLDAGLKYGVLLLTLIAIGAVPALNLIKQAPLSEASKGDAAAMPTHANGWSDGRHAFATRPVSVRSTRGSLSPNETPRLGATVRIPGGSWVSLTLIFWGLLSGALCVRLLASARALRRLVSASQPAPPPLTQRLNYWSERLGLRPIRLRICASVRTPISIGLGHRAILIPPDIAAEWRGEELDPVMLHEAAHLERRDDWTNLAAKVMAALSPFNPAIGMLERRLCEEREIACDTMALRWFNSPQLYAAALLRVAERSALATPPTFSHAMASNSRLSQRLTRIQRGDYMTNPTAPRLLLACTALALGSIAFACTNNPRVQVEASRSPHESANSEESDVTALETSSRQAARQATRDELREQHEARARAAERDQQARDERRRELADARALDREANRERVEHRRLQVRGEREHLRALRQSHLREMRELRDNARHELKESLEASRQALRESLRTMRGELRHRAQQGARTLEHYEAIAERHAEALEHDGSEIEEAVTRELERIDEEIERSLRHLERELETIVEGLGSLDALESMEPLEALEAVSLLDSTDLLEAIPIQEFIASSTTGALTAMEDVVDGVDEMIAAVKTYFESSEHDDSTAHGDEDDPGADPGEQAAPAPQALPNLSNELETEIRIRSRR